MSRVLDLELLCIPKEKMQDWIRNTRWERSDVSHAVFHHDSVFPTGLWQQVCVRLKNRLTPNCPTAGTCPLHLGYVPKKTERAQ